MGNKASGLTDRAAGSLQPQSEKSTTQKATDSLKGNKDSAEGQSKGFIDTAKDKINDLTGNK